ncbi:hypothetical protein DICPUDRAFT_56953 [Dictyostelium purpureum]|uniref:BTB domain-containing protein n=1 Tax=Dictyostelium purpureum TaxID=5786 RepID=F0ZTQ9_DICPU|nr:uncharacterized protein DICPUDRAFT_56953 [Dictyostelium purpureum]EGC32668.1 hypothetical protein DICPUDRAFT_56953 [Dictyostelium purpureum]|eukprot:XP_003290801.1 hypothetical protein DICPUDRAFT_56953 [Dictyostelium purpureum]
MSRRINNNNKNNKIEENDQHFGWGWNEQGQLGIHSFSNFKPYTAYGSQSTQVNACIKKPTFLNNQDDLYSKSVAIGLAHSLLIDSKGQLYSTGKGANGRTGMGNESTIFNFKPVVFNNDELTEANKYRYSSSYYQPRFLNRPITGNHTKVIKISCGGAHSAFITENFELFTFGRNDRGQLGHGLLDQLVIPKKVNYQHYEYEESSKSIKENKLITASNVDLVACGLNHTVFSLVDGCVYSMGDNKHFQLGYVSKEDEEMEYRPRLIESLNLPKKQLEQRYTNIKSISCGSNFSVCVKQGNIYTWGLNSVGQCGFSPKETKSITAPKLLIIYNDASTLSNEDKNQSGTNKKKKPTFTFTQVSCGNDHSLALTTNGEVFAWGESKHGQIGFATSMSTLVDFDTSTPIKVRESLSNESITQIAAGAYHSMALSRSNHIYCWGLNDYYQVGEEIESMGHQKIISTPYRIRAPVSENSKLKSKERPILQIAAGGRSSMAIRRFLLNIEIRPTNYYADIKRIFEKSSFSDLIVQIKRDDNTTVQEIKFHKIFLQRSKPLLDFLNENNVHVDSNTRSSVIPIQQAKSFTVKSDIEDLYENDPYLENFKEIATIDTDLSQHLFTMVNQELFSDIKIKVEYFDPSENKTLKPVIFNAHKCILVNRSEKLKTLLESSYFKESIDNIITINNFTAETYEVYLKYLYTDILNINNENAIELFQLSHQESQYRMKDLIEEYLTNSLDHENVSLIFELALQLNDNQVSASGNNSFLIDRCIYFMSQNLDKVQSSETFKSLSENSKQFLLSNSINIQDDQNIKSDKSVNNNSNSNNSNDSCCNSNNNNNNNTGCCSTNTNTDNNNTGCCSTAQEPQQFNKETLCYSCKILYRDFKIIDKSNIAPYIKVNSKQLLTTTQLEDKIKDFLLKDSDDEN